MERQLYEIIVSCRPRLLQCFTQARQGWQRLEEPRLAARAAAEKNLSTSKPVEYDSTHNYFLDMNFMPGDTCSVDTWGPSETCVTSSSQLSRQWSSQLSRIDITAPLVSSRAGCPSPEICKSPDMLRRPRRGQRVQGDLWDDSPRVQTPNARPKSRSLSPPDSLSSSPETSIAPRWRSAADYGKANDSNLSPKRFLPYCSMLSSLGCGGSLAKPASRQAPPCHGRERSIEDEIAKVRRQLLLPATSSSMRAMSAACKEDASSAPFKPSAMLPPTAPNPIRREASSLPVSTRLRRLHVS